MNDKVKISFEASAVPGAAQSVVIYNPGVLSSALLSQVMRFGLIETRGSAALSGRLKGTQDAFVGMIQSYGVVVDIVTASRMHS